MLLSVSLCDIINNKIFSFGSSSLIYQPHQYCPLFRGHLKLGRMKGNGHFGHLIGHFWKRGDEMTFADLCCNVKKGCPSLRSQKMFIQELTKAAGSMFYESDSYYKQLFSGKKPLTDNLRAQLRGKDNMTQLTAFFEKRIRMIFVWFPSDFCRISYFFL